MNPVVSIIVACYNGEKFLALTLESVHAQASLSAEVLHHLKCKAFLLKMWVGGQEQA